MNEVVTIETNSPYRLRLATIDDIGWIVSMRLLMEAHMQSRSPRLWPTSARMRNSLAVVYHHRIERDDNCVVIAEREDTGEPVGMGMGRVTDRLDIEPSRVAKITEVIVAPEHRRCGICRAIVGRLVSFFRERGAAAITLSYSVGNVEAEQTWRRLGFEPTIVKATGTIEEIEERLKE